MAASTRSVHDYCPGPYRRLVLPANDKYAALHQGFQLGVRSDFCCLPRKPVSGWSLNKDIFALITRCVLLFICCGFDIPTAPFAVCFFFFVADEVSLIARCIVLAGSKRR